MKCRNGIYGFRIICSPIYHAKKLTILVMECNEIQKSNDEFLLSFQKRLIMWCPKMGCHIKREIEGGLKVEICIVEEPSQLFR